MMPVPFVLLICAMAAVWLPAPRLRGWPGIPVWVVLYAASLVAAVAQAYVEPVGAAALLVFAALTVAVRRVARPALYGPLFVLLVLMALALAMHKVPGFHNPIAIDAVRFSPDARPFTQYLNFDKGSVGLLLLAVLAPRLGRGEASGALLARTALLALGVAGVVLGLAAAAGMVRWDPKWPAQTLQFLLVNLFLTCVAEEGFFRVLVQDAFQGLRAGRGAGSRAGAAPSPWGWRTALAMLGSAALFGVAHAGAGAWMIAVAGVAGLGYAAAYAWRRSIEVPILVHLGVNAVHFLLFSYPALQR